MLLVMCVSEYKHELHLVYLTTSLLLLPNPPASSQTLTGRGTLMETHTGQGRAASAPYLLLVEYFLLVIIGKVN